MLKEVEVGDRIKLLHIRKYQIVRNNDRRDFEVVKIFMSYNYVHVVEKSSKYITIACYDGGSYPDDNFYVVKLIDGDFIIKDHKENNYRGAVYYNKDYFGYVGEDDKFVYVAHYSIYCEGINAMRKIKKEKYYKNAVSINDFDYADNDYKSEWGLVGKELE